MFWQQRDCTERREGGLENGKKNGGRKRRGEWAMRADQRGGRRRLQWQNVPPPLPPLPKAAGLNREEKWRLSRLKEDEGGKEEEEACGKEEGRDHLSEIRPSSHNLASYKLARNSSKVGFWGSLPFPPQTTYSKTDRAGSPFCGAVRLCCGCRENGNLSHNALLQYRKRNASQHR